MIISVVNQKDGVGKTTLALNLAAAFSLDKKRVLLDNTDPKNPAHSWTYILAS